MTLEIALQKTRDVIRRNHLSLSTEENYCQWITRFSRFVLEQSPAGTPEQKMERFLTTMGYLHAEALAVRSPLEVQCV